MYSVTAILSEMTTNSAVNRNLASVIKKWNNCFECFHGLIKACKFLHDQLKLSI